MLLGIMRVLDNWLINSIHFEATPLRIKYFKSEVVIAHDGFNYNRSR